MNEITISLFVVRNCEPIDLVLSLCHAVEKFNCVMQACTFAIYIYTMHTCVCPQSQLSVWMPIFMQITSDHCDKLILMYEGVRIRLLTAWLMGHLLRKDGMAWEQERCVNLSTSAYIILSLQQNVSNRVQSCNISKPLFSYVIIYSKIRFVEWLPSIGLLWPYKK